MQLLYLVRHDREYSLPVSHWVDDTQMVPDPYVHHICHGVHETTNAILLLVYELDDHIINKVNTPYLVLDLHVG